jgi:prepilin-type N-terminal cleavage/methylation domain-containing protein
MKRQNRHGFTLIEVLASLVIFGIASAAVFSSYNAQVKQTSFAFHRSKSQMDLQIAKNLIERDTVMAGFGLADDFTGHPNATGLLTETRAIGGTNGAAPASDTLTMMGTALGIGSRAAEGWTVSASAAQAPVTWQDSGRDNLKTGDRYIAMDPFKKKIVLLPPANKWEGTFNAGTASGLAQGTVLFGLDLNALAVAGIMPHYWVQYSVQPSTSLPATCEAGTQALRRDETQIDGMWNEEPLINCVLNMQVAFGLDQNDDDLINLWDNGGVAAALLSADQLNNELKQVRIYVLVQGSNRDPDYRSHSPIRVGDADLGIGEDVALTAEQEKYRWELLAMTVTPRNIR